MRWAFVFLAGALAGIAWIALRRNFEIVRINGPSMAPNYLDGDRVLAARYRGGPLRPGQVVILDGPRPTVDRPGTHGRLVKRIAAVAGEKAPEGVPGDIVPPQHIAVLGDNQSQSVDSRQLGFLSTDLVHATVIRKLSR
ncbi:S26 family signal peptidase [Thermopolyspora sp. NPDC052614]|uniref:S26 family signal peptidase n=1 Tax=Thermopolyspora sp. NPDC052614 TaxID=3155682 RepID=UPI00344328C4